ncbi:MFS transporter [Haladaptatus sp. ZSTT2]|uniref:MFS transporter n=1 Tax=Haladaptatus sp. ZSTT2 TaxID=3120515 RepID=UPI00300F5604
MTDDRWLYAWGLGYAAVGAASLLIPLYALALGSNALLVGLMASTAAFAGVPGALLWGRLATRTGRRRPFVLVALAATALVLAVVPLITEPWLLLVANAALWFVVAAAAPVLNLIVVDGVPDIEWDDRIARLNEVQGFGWLLGLVTGAGWMALAGSRLSQVEAQQLFFSVIAATTFVAFLLARHWYPEPSMVSRDRFLRVYRTLGRGGWGAGRYVRAIPYGPSRIYWGLASFNARRFSNRGTSALGTYLFAAVVFFIGFSVYFGPLPAYLTGLHYSTDQIFILFVVNSAGSAVFYGRVGKLATKWESHRLQTSALGARTLLFPGVALVGGIGALAGFSGLLALFAIIGVTWAIIAVTATSIVTRLAPPAVRGEALGAYTALSSVGGGIGSALGGALADSMGYTVTFGVAAGLVLVGAGLVAAGQAGVIGTENVFSDSV